MALESKRFRSWPARLLFGLMTALSAPMSGALVFADPPGGFPLWFRVAAGVIAAALVVIALRLFTMAIVVTSTRLVLVRGGFRTTRVPTHRAKEILSPDWDSVASVPRLLLDDGETVKLTPIMRVKNRMWGADKTSDRNIKLLAEQLAIPVRRGDRNYGWG